MNSTADFELTILIPVFNDADTLPELFRRVDLYKQKSARHFCVMFIDDCSNDKSLSLIRDYCMRVKDAFYISLLKCSGLTGALKAGLFRVHSRYVAYVDSAMRTDIKDLDKLFAEIHDAALVCGQRNFKKHGLAGHLMTRFLASVRRMVTGDGLKDASCPIRLGRTEILKEMPWFSGMHAFLPALVAMSGNRVVAVNVSYKRHHRVGYSALRMALSGSCDLMVFLWMRRHYLDPAVSDGNLQNR
ncbi:MAG: glycosyltransferase family 2 protein [Succinatimonas hippei]|nr:glycosyltransferase family 2 protein [Succinatimonas hippei]